jgi:hypothetical protein
MIEIVAILFYVTGAVITALFLMVQYRETRRESLLVFVEFLPFWPIYAWWFVGLLFLSFFGIGPGLDNTAVSQVDRREKL